MQGPATTSADDGGGVDNASPSPRAVQMGSTDSSDGHLRSSSDFEAAIAAAANAGGPATATAVTTATADTIQCRNSSRNTYNSTTSISMSRWRHRD